VSILGQVSSGGAPEGQRIVIAAVEKVGKTTLVANAPRALLIPLEMGYASIKTPKTPLITSYDDLFTLLDEIKAVTMAGKNEFLTLSFDSATALEQLIHKKVIATDPDVIKGIGKNVTMETAHGGYGKAYNLANDYFSRFTRYCDELAKYGKLNIVITCHVFPSLVKDAAYGEYNSWDLLLHSPKNDKTYGKREMMTQWADMIGFLHEPLFVQKAEKGQTITKGISAGQGRVLAVDRTPGWVAGNRYGLTGLIPIPPVNGWNNLAHAIYTNCGIDVYNRDVK
jgi:hypothetical protein